MLNRVQQETVNRWSETFVEHAMFWQAWLLVEALVALAIANASKRNTWAGWVGLSCFGLIIAIAYTVSKLRYWLEGIPTQRGRVMIWVSGARKYFACEIRHWRPHWQVLAAWLLLFLAVTIWFAWCVLQIVFWSGSPFLWALAAELLVVDHLLAAHAEMSITPLRPAKYAILVEE